jgi:hypothetical protein
MRHSEVRTRELTSSVGEPPRFQTCRRRGQSRRRQVRRASTRLIAALLLAGVADAACYRYVPIAPATAASNAEVRVHITEDAAARLSKELGAYVTELDGQWAQQGADSVSVSIPIERTYNGMTVGTTSQVLYLGRSEVVDVRRRQFDRARTVLVSAGAVVGFGLLAAAVVQLADPNPDSQEPPPPPPPTPVRIPISHLFTVRIPVP